MKRRPKVLIVDDESDMRFYLCNLLDGSGYAPIPAADRREALHLARKDRPSLIIMDVMMADTDGLLLYRALNQDMQLKRIPVIMLSSVGRKTFMEYQRSCGAAAEKAAAPPAAYLKKPLNADELLGWVRTLAGPAREA